MEAAERAVREAPRFTSREAMRARAGAERNAFLPATREAEMRASLQPTSTARKAKFNIIDKLSTSDNVIRYRIPTEMYTAM